MSRRRVVSFSSQPCRAKPDGPAALAAMARVLWTGPAEALGFEWQAEAYRLAGALVDGLARHGGPLMQATSSCAAYVHNGTAMADFSIVPRSGSQEDAAAAMGILREALTENPDDSR